MASVGYPIHQGSLIKTMFHGNMVHMHGFLSCPRCTIVRLELLELDDGLKDIFLCRNITLWHLAASIVRETAICWQQLGTNYI